MTTVALTPLEWALVLAGIGVLGYFLNRLVRTIDELKEAVTELHLLIAKEYSTKDNVKEAIANHVLALHRRGDDARSTS